MTGQDHKMTICTKFLFVLKYNVCDMCHYMHNRTLRFSPPIKLFGIKYSKVAQKLIIISYNNCKVERDGYWVLINITELSVLDCTLQVLKLELWKKNKRRDTVFSVLSNSLFQLNCKNGQNTLKTAYCGI